MIIEIPDCKIRIKGSGIDWQVQYPVERKDGKGDGFVGKYFFPSLDGVIAKTYELALMESAKTVDIGNVAEECKRIKKQLIKAVKAATDE